MEAYYRQKAGTKVRDYVTFINYQLNKRNLKGLLSRYNKFSEHNRSTFLKEWLINGILEEIRREMNPAALANPGNYTLESFVAAVQDAEWLWSLRLRQTKRITQAVFVNQGFELDGDGYVIAYTDGACLGNGKVEATGGIGVCFGPNNPCNLSITLDPSYRQTNNVAEIRSAIEAINVVKLHGLRRIAIHTDSGFLFNSMEMYIFQWLKNGWRKYDGKAVVNRPEFCDLLMAMEDVDIKWIKVPAHQPAGTGPHSYGNNEADRLAKLAASKNVSITRPLQTRPIQTVYVGGVFLL